MKAQPTIRNRYVFIGDVIFMVVSVLGSYVLRLELGPAFYIYLPSAYWMLGVVLVIKPAHLLLFWPLQETLVICEYSGTQINHCHSKRKQRSGIFGNGESFYVGDFPWFPEIGSGN